MRKEKKGFKKKKKEFRYWIGWIIYNIFEWIMTRLPLKHIYFFSEKLGIIAYYLSPGYRRKILNNINFALGNEKSKEEIKRISKDVGRGLFKLFFEMQHIIALPAEKIKDIISLEGKENLDTALAKGKGVIAVSAHLGNFTILGPKLAAEGYSFNIITKDLVDPRIVKRLNEYANTLHMKIIPYKPQDKCIKIILKSLRNNEIVCFIADESYPSGGVFVNFFGHPAPTATGPAVFSLRTGAEIVPMFLIRHEANKNKLIIDPAIDIELSGDKKKDTVSITERFTNIIEDYIRLYPSQWPWINKRWRLKHAGRKRRKKRR
ncbi:MAG: lysophospholipid acyltransferase family protein [Thermodesulfobacteriota bacterium]|nr:lysophospholipid acyltransferase family protein [Thermodesulfobacteriota bacterium]